MIFTNKVINKGQLKKLISWSFGNYGTARTANLADKLKALGFSYATRAAVSISVDDLQVPPSKREMLEEAEEEIRITEDRYTKGEITEVERFQKVIDTWNITSESLKDEVVRHFKATNPLNSVYMMAFSGARGNISQVRQLVGMRGLMADPHGEIIDLPIKTNFREGLTVTEYIISSYGARKGLVDTALRTADSGYLTRRLVDVSQDVIVRELDCGTTRGIVAKSMTEGDRVLIPLKDRLLGRVLAADVYHPKTGEIVACQETQAVRNQAISDELANAIGKSEVPFVIVRSPLTCESPRSVCQHCYGWSLAHAKLVDMGEAIGIIAAQSIGEPGTQLTMRTFHTGGVFTGELARSVTAPFAGTLQFPQGLRARPFRTRHGDEAFVLESPVTLTLVGQASRGRQRSEAISVNQGAILMVKDGQKVAAGAIIAEVPKGGSVRKTTEKVTKEVASDLAGELKFDSVVAEEKTDRTGSTTRIAAKGGLIWILAGEVYNLPPGAEAVVKNGEAIAPGSVIAITKLTTEHGGVVRFPANDEDFSLNPEASTEEGVAGDELASQSSAQDIAAPNENVDSPYQSIESISRTGDISVIPGSEGALVGGQLDAPGSGALSVETEETISKNLKDEDDLPREIEVITASVLLDQAKVRVESFSNREHYVIETQVNQKFALKVTPGSKVGNHEVIAELMDDSYRTTTGGIIKYAGVEVARRSKAKQGYEVVKGGTLLWIPEECHEVNKDISLLRVEDGQYVEAGMEIVQEVFCQSAGIVEVHQKNDILREITIKPGELHMGELDANLEELSLYDAQIVTPGEEVIPGLKVSELKYVEYVETPEGLGLLLRPVQEFPVPDQPSVPSQKSINSAIELRAVQRLPYKDGERVKSVEGIELLRTQLILEIGEDAPQLAADIELLPDLSDEDDDFDVSDLAASLPSAAGESEVSLGQVGAIATTNADATNATNIANPPVFSPPAANMPVEIAVPNLPTEVGAIEPTAEIENPQTVTEVAATNQESPIPPPTATEQQTFPEAGTSPVLEARNESDTLTNIVSADVSPVENPNPGTVLESVNTESQIESSNIEEAEAEAVEVQSPVLSRKSMRLQLVILESLVIRRDMGADATTGSTHTRLLVKDGDAIAPGAVVARTEILSKEGGEVRGIKESGDVSIISPKSGKKPVSAVRRLLVVRETDLMRIQLPSAPTVGVGQLLVAGAEIAPGVTTEESAVVVTITQLREASSAEIESPESQINHLTPSYELVLRRSRPYRVSTGAILLSENEDLVQRGDNLVLLVFERAKTGDIIQGLPRIEELLEARKPRESCVLCKYPGIARVEVNDDIVDLSAVGDDGTITQYQVGPGQNAIVSDGQRVEVGEPLTDGPRNPHEILEIFFNYYRESLPIFEAALKSFEAAQTFLVNEVQSVYQSQGIDISDKHIEVIVRQMTAKVRIDDGGDTIMLPGELVELRQVEQVNEAMSITGGATAEYTPVLLGITKASLNTDSFISAASFQETTRVLTEAAIEGKSDWLRGLKENVIIGRLIPAGTGFTAYEEDMLSEGEVFEEDVLEDDEEMLSDDSVSADPMVALGEELRQFGDWSEDEVEGEVEGEAIAGNLIAGADVSIFSPMSAEKQEDTVRGPESELNLASNLGPQGGYVKSIDGMDLPEEMDEMPDEELRRLEAESERVDKELRASLAEDDNGDEDDDAEDFPEFDENLGESI